MLLTNIFSSHDFGRVQVSTTVDPGSYDTAEFAALYKPRYHFARSDGRTNYQYVSSFPFVNVGVRLSSGKLEQHVCRFVSLGPLLSRPEEKRYGKSRKFLHAFGVSSLTDMSPMEFHKRPLDTVMESPYTDKSYECDNNNGKSGGSIGVAVVSSSSGINNNSTGLSTAQSRRIVMEEEVAQEQSSFRWTTNRSKRPRPKDGTSTTFPDPFNKCLYVSGISNTNNQQHNPSHTLL